jgi:hypothetical protein
VGRTIAIAFAWIAACRFSPQDAATTGDGSIATPRDGSAHTNIDAVKPDAAIAPVGSACGGKLWHADFSVDPTTIDLNDDGVYDFATRDGSPLAGTLGSDIWTVPANSAALDTRPAQPFTTRVVVDVDMTNIVPTTDASQLSTVFWINTAYTQTTFAPLFIDIRRDAAESQSQTWTAYNKVGSNAIQSSVDAGSYGDVDFHHFHIDIDPSNPSAPTYHLTVDTNDRGIKSYSTIPRDSNGDQWATLDALGGSSAFHDFQVEVCP